MPRLSYRATKSPSRLEDRFLMLWKAVGDPPLEREYRFHAARRWRPDFAHLQARCLIEVEGGIWVNGRHSQSDWREERQIMRQHDPQGEADERRRLSQPGGWLQCRSGTVPSGGRRDRFRAAEPGGLAAREAGRESKIPGSRTRGLASVPAWPRPIHRGERATIDRPRPETRGSVPRVQHRQHLINRSPTLLLNRRGIQTREDGRQLVLKLVAQQFLRPPHQTGPRLAHLHPSQPPIGLANPVAEFARIWCL